MSEDGLRVRSASRDELPAVMNVLDGALLATDAAEIEAHIDRQDVLVAVERSSILGACVLAPDGGVHDEGAYVDAIAVRPRRRGQGIGRVLVDEATVRHGGLTADFDERARGFYESLGFEIVPDGDRYRGTFEP